MTTLKYLSGQPYPDLIQRLARMGKWGSHTAMSRGSFQSSWRARFHSALRTHWHFFTTQRMPFEHCAPLTKFATQYLKIQTKSYKSDGVTITKKKQYPWLFFCKQLRLNLGDTWPPPRPLSESAPSKWFARISPPSTHPLQKCIFFTLNTLFCLVGEYQVSGIFCIGPI